MRPSTRPGYPHLQRPNPTVRETVDQFIGTRSADPRLNATGVTTQELAADRGEIRADGRSGAPESETIEILDGGVRAITSFGFALPREPPGGRR
jgi:hypothetical protein